MKVMYEMYTYINALSSYNITYAITTRGLLGYPNCVLSVEIAFNLLSTPRAQ